MDLWRNFEEQSTELVRVQKKSRENALNCRG